MTDTTWPPPWTLNPADINDEYVAGDFRSLSRAAETTR